MKAFRNSAGVIEYFKWDTDMLYYDSTSVSNSYSNVTYTTAGTVNTITGPGGDVFTASANFSKDVLNSTTSSAVTCSTSNYNRYFNSYNNTARRLLESSPARELESAPERQLRQTYHKRWLDHDRNSTYSYGGYYSYSNYYSYYSSYCNYYYTYSCGSYSNYYSYYYSYSYSYNYYDYYYYSGSDYAPYECQCIDSGGFNFFNWIAEFFQWLAELFMGMAGNETNPYQSKKGSKKGK